MYPIYDRSGVEDSSEPIGSVPSSSQARRVAFTADAGRQGGDEPPPKPSTSPPTEVHVCHAGTCRSRGAEAVLAEIEELVSEVGGGCIVKKSGCLGVCNQAPNAVVRERSVAGGRPTSSLHAKIRSLEASAKVVQRATGKRVSLDDARSSRLAGLRAVRARQHAISESKWNAALKGLVEEAARRPALRSELGATLSKAGLSIEHVGGGGGAGSMPPSIANYSPWSLVEVVPVSRHSALFRYASKDVKRGTPHPRGRGRMVSPVTWHATMLAQVNSAHTVLTRCLHGAYTVLTRCLHGAYTVLTRCLHGSGRMAVTWQ